MFQILDRFFGIDFNLNSKDMSQVADLMEKFLQVTFWWRYIHFKLSFSNSTRTL